MKHIKEFNQMNEGLMLWILNAAAAFSFYKIIRKLIKDIKPEVVAGMLANNDMRKYKKMSPEERVEYEKASKHRLVEVRFKIFIGYLDDFFKNNGEVKFSENMLYYIFELDDLMIKIHKEQKNIRWNPLRLDRSQNPSKWVVSDNDSFIEPIRISEEDIEYLVNSVKEQEMNHIKEFYSF